MSEESKSAVDSYLSTINSLSSDLDFNSSFIGYSTDSVDLSSASISSGEAVIESGTTGTIASVGSGVSSTGGTTTLPYTTPNIWGSISNWTSTYSTPSTSKENPDLDLLEDLKEEFKGKLEEAEKNIEELVGQMKEHPEGMPVFNGAFNFFTGQKVILTEIIKKLESYIKDYTGEETNE